MPGLSIHSIPTVDYILFTPASRKSVKMDHALWLRPGTVIGERYRLANRLAKTQMSEIWKGRDLKEDKAITLKFANANQVKYLRNEGDMFNVINGSNHSFFPDFYGYNVSDGWEFILLEYIPGITLNNLIKREERIPLHRIIEIGMQLCQALNLLHKHGIIHRDVKPANVIIGSDVRLIDFGLACKSGFQDQTLEGTPAYLSPEQVEGRSLDLRLDIYSLGLVFYKMITKENPMRCANLFELNSLRARLETVRNQVVKPMPLLAFQEIEQRVLANKQRKLRRKIKRLHSLLQKIIRKMTEKDRKARCRDLEGMQSKLKKAHKIAKRLAPFENLS